MAKKESAPPAAAPATEAAPAKKKGKMGTIIVVAGAMLLQTIIVVVVMKKFGPAKAVAEVGHHEIKTDDGSKTEEIEIADEKFQNLKTGRVWIWDVSIFVQVKARNAEAVKAALERRNAEIKQELNQLFSRAEHVQLKEPERQTVSRQLTESLQRIFGNDDKNEPMIEKVLIPKFRGFPADL